MTDSTSSVDAIGDYKPGSILRVKLHNFLTYEDVEFSPGPRLNMVIGPNGTGKSSILCALCLALGGEPRLLGRADDPRDFIMKEKDRAMIEVELAPQPGGETHVFRRTIDRDKGGERGQGASSFYINSAKSKAKEVRKIVSDVYHISIDNLCTFLPQDRVGSFSGFDQRALLIETEKAMSSSHHLYNVHQDLIKAEAEINSGANDVSTIESKLRRLEAENERLEAEKERMEERERALEQAELLQKKLLWMQFDETRLEVVELKEKKAAVKKEVQEARALIQPLEQRHSEFLAKKQEAEAKFRSLDQGTQKAKKERQKQTQKYESHDDSVESKMSDLQMIDANRKKLEEKRDKAKDRLNTLEAAVADMDSMESVEEALHKVADEHKACKPAYTQARRVAQEYREEMKEIEDKIAVLQQKVAQMEDEKARRNERIFRQLQDVKRAHTWIEQNRTIFRRPVWGPIVCEVTMKSQNAAAFLEQHVPNATLKAFVVETKADYDLLYNKVRRELKIPINIQLVPNGVLQPISQRMYSDQKMEILKREHGVTGYLDESFTAPDPVMQALKNSASVHKVIVGGEKTKKSIDNNGLLNFLVEPDRNLGQTTKQAACVFSSLGPNSFKNTVGISDYGDKNQYMRDDTVSAARWLVQGVNPEHKAAKKEELRVAHEEMNEFRPKMADAERELAEAQSHMQQVEQRLREAKATRDARSKIDLKLNNARSRLRDAEAELNSDDTEAKRTLIQQLMNCIASSITALEEQGKCDDRMLKTTFTSAAVRISKESLVVAERKARQELLERKNESQEIERRAERVLETFNRAKQRLTQLKNRAEELAPLEDAEGNELPLKAKLEALPVETTAEVQAALEDAMAKANAIDENPDVIRQYEARKVEIEEVKLTLEDLAKSKDIKLKELDRMIGPWQAALETAIQKVDVLFARYMGELGYKGEVKLVAGKNEEGKPCNFNDWGIEIRVSFREGVKAQVLSARVQSGGERSVSTIMYLMALQEMMVSPFRCVDEINQGLDERNERFVFRRIVENSTQPPKESPIDHCGQYFLITPKLLPNLYDMEVEAMTVLCIFNGPHNLKNSTDWNVNDLIQLRKRSSVDPADDEENVPNGNSSSQDERRTPKRRRNS